MLSSRLWQLFLDSFPKILLPGLTATIPLTIISFSLALVIAVVAALVQFANIQGLKQIARFYIWIFRGTPLLVQLFVVFFGLSRVGIVLDPFPAAVIVFSLNEGAYCAERIRHPGRKSQAVQKPSGRHWKPFRRVSWKPVFVQDFPIYRPFSASCSPRRCVPHFRRCPTP